LINNDDDKGNLRNLTRKVYVRVTGSCRA